MLVYALTAAVILDFLVKEPSSRWHPVAWLGQAVEFCKQQFLASSLSPGQLRAGGFIVALFFPLAVYFSSSYLLFLAAKLSWVTSFLLSCFFFWLSICFNDLRKRGLQIKNWLQHNQLERARKAASEIVGRNLKQADKVEITRATLESLAENTVDGCLAPIFYGLIGGPPLALAYRVVNTLDAILGYKKDKLRYFGWAAARLDDLANFIPARLFAFLSSLVAAKPTQLVSFVKNIFTDGRRHPSPNSGLSIAAVANCLGIKLGGVNDYLSYQVKVGPFNAQGKDNFSVFVINQEVRLLLNVYFLFLLFSFLVKGLFFGGLR